MTPAQFIAKWRCAELKERSASQEHFLDLCELLDIEKPASADPKGEWFTFEKGASKTGGGPVGESRGWADVWRKHCFAWEYKGKKKDLDRAFAQLQQYAIALDNPPLLIVSDMDRFRIHTNWTNTVQEVHEFALDDLLDGATRDLLRACFLDPDRLKPAKTRQMLTEEAAEEFSGLAQRLRGRGHDAHTVAHFVNRLVFCMFAEDVGLLPDHMFTKMLRASAKTPDRFEGNAAKLFAAMHKGGDLDFTPIEWFNGGLFDDDSALPLERADIDNLIAAAALDWSEIDPSILGTLFERGLDPDKRSQLGAHYTDRDKIMQIVEPVIIRPLAAEWDAVRGEIEARLLPAENAAQILLADAGKQTELSEEIRELEASLRDKPQGELFAGMARQKRVRKLDSIRAELRTASRDVREARDFARILRNEFVERLRNFRVLDPACGSGNFLYLSLLALKDIEHRANIEAEVLGVERTSPTVGPECVLGIELNPYAAELARVSVWIGEIQWMRRNGFEASRNPILKPLGTIENRDAVLVTDAQGNPVPDAAGKPQRAAWPDADVVVGNPPFLGNKKMIAELGEDYTRALRKAWPQVPGGADLVCYWFAGAWDRMVANKLSRAGLVATNSIRSGANREVLRPIVENGRIFEAWSDESWTVDGAAVRVSLVSFDSTVAATAVLDGEPVTRIFADLSAERGGADLTSAAKLKTNRAVAFQGPVKVGPFDVDGSIARDWLLAPSNPNGRTNADVVRPLLNGMDITRRPSDRWIVNFEERPVTEASLYEKPFEFVRSAVKPLRDKNRDQQRRENWWRLGRSGRDLSEATMGLNRAIFSPRVAKYRLFVWAPAAVVPDSRVVAIARDDDTSFGVLHCRFHEVWSLALGGWHGVGNDPQYTPSLGFETFPFPEGLTPDIPAADYAADPRAQAIAAAAERLNTLRENWLNPPDLVERVPEVVPGYPDRILPKDEAAAQELKKRTLTNLYNARPAWLDHAHRALDEAVADAYGWGEDYRAGALTDDEILARLFRLNQQRAAR